jgi:hypothetical protein
MNRYSGSTLDDFLTEEGILALGCSMRMKSKSLTITKANRSSVPRMPPVHPGEILLEEFLKPLGLSQYRLAKGLGVPAAYQ